MTSLSLWGELSVLQAHIVAASIKGTLILIAAIALCFALRRGSAAVRHLVWSLALTGMVTLPVLSIGLPVWQIAVLPVSAIDSVSIAGDSTETKSVSPVTSISIPSDNNPVPATAEEISLEPKTEQSAGGSLATTARSLGWISWALGLWLAGTLLMLGRLLTGIGSIWWIARRATGVTDPRTLKLAADIADQIELKRPAPILLSHHITMPVACGVFWPRILLPTEADDWTPERLQVVLLHELAHVKRRDCLTQLMGQLACSVYWFNPLVWFASRQLRIERERACDDQVIHLGTKASDYAGHLLDMARTFRSGRCSSLATIAIARRSQLERRLIAILDPSLKRRGLDRLAAVAVGAVILCVLLPLASVRLSAQTNNSYRAASRAASPEPQRNSSEFADLSDSRLTDDRSSQSAAAGPNGSATDQTGEETTESGSTQQIDNGQAINALREALKDDDPTVRQHAMFALTQVGDQEALTALVEALKDPSWQTRANAASGLGLRGNRNSVEALVGALRDSNWQVREQAAWALGLRGDSRAVEPLIDTLKDESNEVREKAAWALGLKGDQRSVEPLMSALKDANTNVRGMAAWALGLKSDSRAGDALREALRDSDKQVRQKAAWALGMLLMKLGGAPTGLHDPDNDNDRETDSKKASGGVTGGVAGGIPNGVSGGVPGGVNGGVPGGVQGGAPGSVPGGVSGGVHGGVPGGVRKFRLSNPGGSGTRTLDPGNGESTTEKKANKSTSTAKPNGEAKPR